MNLEPLREALKAQADADAERRQAEVDAECKRKLATAEAEARSLVAQGRREGERAAAQAALRRRALASRRGRELRLAAQRSLVDELRLRAHDQVLELRTDPGYRELLDRLSRAARSQLGSHVELEVDAPGVGGVIGRAGRQSVDYSLPALVERAIEDLDGELEALWR
ncbi:MAG TPA: hypothetical protein VMS63_08530 [Gaiellaceae bacterium]|nr:hypothetical protein [Gaiellaceae bacterium]